jgi:hypothetical protein
MTLTEFTELVERVKTSIKSKRIDLQKTLTIINREGVKLQFIPDRYNQPMKRRISATKKIIVECTLYCEKDDGKIIVPQGTKGIYQELVNHNKIDLVQFAIEEFILGRV